MTEWIEAFPLRSSDAEEAGHALFNGVVLRHGCCRTLITDRGSNFTSVLLSELCKLLQVRKVHTTAHHPEGNGVAERANGTIVRMLALFVNENQNNWSELLPIILFSYHASYNRSIKMTPFEAMFGRRALMPLDLEHYTTPNSRNLEALTQVEVYMQKFETMQERTWTNNRKSQAKSKERCDERRTDKSFQPADS